MQHADQMKEICSEIKELKRYWKNILKDLSPEDKKEYRANPALIAYRAPKVRTSVFDDSDSEPEIYFWDRNYAPETDIEIELAKKMPYSKKLWLHKKK